MATAETPANRSQGTSWSGAPVVSLPKGGGAIRGIGERFAANPVTGTGSMSVPIWTSPGRSGVDPQLSLSYDSGSGNGPFGFGWSLALPSITRKTDRGLPEYRDSGDSDVFLLSGADDLVPVFDEGARFVDGVTVPEYTIHRYRPRVDVVFARIERWTRMSDGDVHWRSISRDNVLTVYGKDGGSRIADPHDETRVFSWLICETRDDRGNATLYEYKPEDGVGADVSQAHERQRGPADDARRTANRYPKRIRYGNRVPLLDDAGHRPPWVAVAQIENARWMFEVVFDYGEHDVDTPTPKDIGRWTHRTDPFSTYRAGFEVRTARVCRRVLMFHHFEGEPGVGNDCLVRSTDMVYADQEDPAGDSAAVYLFLRSVAQTGYQRYDGGYLRSSLPPVEFDYTQAVVQDTVHEVDAESVDNLPIGIDGDTYQWTDLHGEGIPGILTKHTGAWFYKRNVSPISERPVEFSALERVATTPNLVRADVESRFMDLAGDGQPDLVVLDGPTPGLYEHDDEESWQPFRAFTSWLNRDARDPNVRFIDLDGDGRVDVLVSEDDALVWHASMGEEGFGPPRHVPHGFDEETGPRLVFADGTDSIHLADLSGDGLADLVRIRNGEICYWPNLGYCRFGAKVTMDSAPRFDKPDQFDPKRILLADIDGTGTTDVIYLHSDGVHVYFNQSGNSWSARRALPVHPRIDRLVAVAPADLLGNGTACLVWSSPLPSDTRPRVRYVDLMGEKPHLLTRIVNNLGSETRVRYAPSTKFYLEDKRDGQPWITRLPFPVHVVERVETYDHISRNRFVTRYRYHHGFFDGDDREFRGFGMVEQWDTEAFAAMIESDAFPAGDNIDTASHVPPVHTKSWFHTGVNMGRDHVSDFFAGLIDTTNRGEYYREPGLTDAQARALLLPDAQLPEGLTLEEEHEACRALKGSMLRREVYALDGTPNAEHPYTVTEQNFTVRCLQPRQGSHHAVFVTHGGETLDYHYERDPIDPRVQHGITLEVDAFGNVLKEAAIGYGRRQPDPSLPLPADRDRQTTTLVTYTERRVTNAIADVAHHPFDYRTPLRCDTLTFELTGYVPTDAGGRFRPSDFVQPDPADPNEPPSLIHIVDGEVDYEDEPINGRQRRMIEHVRTLYRPDDLGAAQDDPLHLLSLGTLQPLALQGETYKLAFTPGLLVAVFQRDGQPLLPDPAAVVGGAGPGRGGYVRSQDLRVPGPFPASDPDDQWWIPTGRVFLSPATQATASQELAHARGHFFLTHRYRGPLHTATVSSESIVTYDDHDLLLIETRDPVGNVMTVGERLANGERHPTQPGNDYRVLQPMRLMDLNRNRTEVAFDALGMLVATATLGKPDEDIGDSLDGFVATVNESASLDHLADPMALLGRATTRLIYDLFAYQRTKNQPIPQPVVVLTMARETHDRDLQPGEQTRVQQTFAYSDGLGREIQKKMQAEPGPLVDDGPVISPRWVGTGWNIFNNKGKPVLQYEPFFCATQRFEFGVQIGVSPVRFYDPVERIVATVYPNHTYEKTVFHPWHQTTWDENDTVLDDPGTDHDIAGLVSAYFARLPLPAGGWQTWHAQRAGGALGAEEQATAAKAAAHARTPTTVHLDTLGRPFLTLAHNGFNADTTPIHFATRVELDIEGNQRAVRDAIEQNGEARGRIVAHNVFDLLGNVIHGAGMEAGRRWALADVAGRPMRSWDSRGHAFRTKFDPLHRPTHHYVAGIDPADPDRELLVERLVYGEQHPEAEHRNLRGNLHLHLDQAGAAVIDAHDFKGNAHRVTRRLASEYKQAIDWSAVDAVLPALPANEFDAVALEDAIAPRLEGDAFTSTTVFDALDRPATVIPPHAPTVAASIIWPRYNEANLLERLDVNLHGAQVNGEPEWTPFVTNIDYDAKGQRRRIEYGNGVTSVFEYDPLTFRLVHLRTRRDPADFPGDCPRTPRAGWAGREVQNLDYSYDPVGNVAHLRDAAQQAVFFRDKRVEPSADYTYDAVYRLVEATGREHLGQAGGVPMPHSHADAGRVRLSHPGDGNAMGTYVERYVYDSVGSLVEMRHRGTDPAHAGWTRAYEYAEPSAIEPAATSNRVSSTTAGANSSVERYLYDAHGNVNRMPHLSGAYPSPNMQWDHRDRLVRTDLGGGGTAYYAYDGSGRRVRKVWEKSANLVEERIYLYGFEVFRRRRGADGVTFERETVQIIDGERHVAHVETRGLDTAGTDEAPSRLVRFLFGNHLGSTSLELDDRAQVISCEEYTPYGSTAYQAVRSQTETPSRYRFANKERDEESGFSYFGARYLAPWLGIWIAVDPALLVPLPARRRPETTSGDEQPPSSETNAAGSQPARASRPVIPNEPDTAPRLQPYVFALCNPVTLTDADGAEPVKIGYIYTLRAEVNGQPVVYSGQTARELAQRLYKDKHKWSSIIKAKTTTIEAHEVKATLDVAGSGKGTLASAKKEALSAAEQVIVKRRRAEVGLKGLNSIEAAEEANIVKWADRHSVRLGPRFTFRAGVKVGAFAGFMLLDVFMMYRDEKVSKYVMAPYVLEDEHGVFTLQEHDRGIFRQNHYFKNYETGPLKGQSVQVSKDEFYGLVEEAKLLWGYVDWMGDWVPGLLRRELPVVDWCTANPDRCA